MAIIQIYVWTHVSKQLSRFVIYSMLRCYSPAIKKHDGLHRLITFTIILYWSRQHRQFCRNAGFPQPDRYSRIVVFIINNYGGCVICGSEAGANKRLLPGIY